MDGSGESLYGRVTGYRTDSESACLACSWDETVWHEVSLESGGTSCALLAGLEHQTVPTLAVPGMGMLVASVAVIQAVRVLAGRWSG